MKPYAMPKKTTIKHEGCFKNAEVMRVQEVLNVIDYKPEKSYRSIKMVVNDKLVVVYVDLDSLVECILVSDITMIGIIKTLYGDRTIEKGNKKVIPFEVLHEICDAIISRKVDVRAKNRAKLINTLTSTCYMLHVNSFPLKKIQDSINMTAEVINNATPHDEQRVTLMVRNLIADLQKHIGD